MASIGSSDAGNKLNTELNLVPFIDLLSTLVLFLLVTTVWLHVSVLPAGKKAETAAGASEMKPEARLTIRLTPEGHEFQWPVAQTDLPRLLPRTDNKVPWSELSTLLKLAAEKHQVAGVAVAGNDQVGYGEVIRTIDEAKSAGLKYVGISLE